MACTKTCKNCALRGNDWAATCSIPRQRNKDGDCIWWEPKGFWEEVCSSFKDEPEVYIGKHIRPRPLRKSKTPIIIDGPSLRFAAGEHE